MKCIDCDSCRKGWFADRPDSYVCIGVRHPFVIGNVDHECTEYPEKNTITDVVSAVEPMKPAEPFVDDDGIYVPHDVVPGYHKMIISRELFVEAYNKWIKGDCNGPD